MERQQDSWTENSAAVASSNARLLDGGGAIKACLGFYSHTDWSDRCQRSGKKGTVCHPLGTWRGV